jgi:hypothetical protein
MIHLFVSLALVVIGIGIIRRSRHPGGSKRAMRLHIQNLERVNQVLLSCTNDLKEHRTQLLNRMTLLENNRQLDQAVAEDAIKREQRAKVALTAVLKHNGCNEAEITRVIDSVEDKSVEDL